MGNDGNGNQVLGGNFIERTDGDYLMPKTGNARKGFKSDKERLIHDFAE